MPRLPDVQRFVTSGDTRIYRIPCKVLPHLTARVYLVLGAGDVTLVDVGSGQGESTRNVLDGLRTVRDEFGESVRPKDIRRILLTHGHLDHVGGLADMLDQTDAQIGIHPLDSVSITACAERGVLRRHKTAWLLQQTGVPSARHEELLQNHVAQPSRLPTVTVDVAMEDGMTLDGMEFIHTPGHSPGHVCIAIDDVLLGGDHILPRTIPQQWPESIRPYTGLGHYLESLEKIRRRTGLRWALGGHEPVIEDVYKRIDDIQRSQQRRLDRLVDVLGKAERPLTVWEASQAIYLQSKGFYVLLTLMDTAARAEYLHQRGRLAIANLDEVAADERAPWRYRPVGA